MDQNKLLKLLSSERSGLQEMYSKLIERNFTIGEAEIARKTLNDWQKEGLLPFTNHEKGWTRFSLVEYVWLRCISELRSLGIPIEKIKRVKTFFFSINVEEYKELFLTTLEGFDEVAIPEKEQLLSVFKQKDIAEELWLEVMQGLQISMLTMLVLEVLIYNINLCFTIDTEDRLQIVVLGTAIEERTKKSEVGMNNLLESSFVLINLRKIVQGFFSKDTLKYDNEYILSFLKPKEKKIIEKIQKGGIKEITIRFDKKSEPRHIKLTSSEITEETLGRVARLMKKGGYGTITLKQENGKLVHFEQTDIEKL